MTAIVAYRRTPHFRATDSVSAADLCPWDPYAVLGLPREQPTSLQAAVVLPDVFAEPLLNTRQRLLTEAYHALSVMFHPDKQHAPAFRLYSWMTPQGYWAAIETAYSLLSDVPRSLRYLELTDAAAQQHMVTYHEERAVSAYFALSTSSLTATSRNHAVILGRLSYGSDARGSGTDGGAAAPPGSQPEAAGASGFC
jgi:hypothetical protein